MSRISPASLTVCILAVLFGLGGAYALRTYLKPKPQAAVRAPDQETVPIASVDLPVGRIVTRGDIGLMLRRTLGELPPHTIARPENVIGRVLSAPMKPGDTFQTTNLFPEGGGPNLAEHLKAGLRAVTVPVDSLGTIGGYVRPGVIVDVLFRATPRTDKQGFEEIPEVTVTLFERVEVLAVGPDPLAPRSTTPQRLGAEERKNPMVNVTLACSPAQSGKLRAVLGHGEIALAMHPEAKAEPPMREVKQVLDNQVLEAKPVGFTLENILGVDPQPKQAKTEIYRGGNRTTNTFDVRKHRSTLLNVLVDAPQIPPKVSPEPAPAMSVAGPAVVTDQN